jgi:competence ComEA-like helix-hairpin-helix protein
MRESPPATHRRRHVALLLEILVFGVLAVSAGGRLPRAVRAPPGPAPTPPPPLAVDVESDPQARLELLPGIGPTRAAAIVRERETGGPFSTVDGLARVHGIGPVTVQRIRTAREVRPCFGNR